MQNAWKNGQRNRFNLIEEEEPKKIQSNIHICWRKDARIISHNNQLWFYPLVNVSITFAWVLRLGAQCNEQLNQSTYEFIYLF